MRFHTFNRSFSKFIISSTVSVYLSLAMLLFSSLFPGFAAASEEVELSLTDQNLDTIGLIWTYHRPDNSPTGNSTSWKLRWSPDGDKIAVVFFDDTTLILDGKTGELIKALGSGAEAVLQAMEDKNSTDDSKSKSTRCWGYTSNPIAPILRACVWSPDGKLLAVAGDHKKIEFFNTSNWERVHVLEGHTGSILSLDWSPDGTRLASGEGTDQVLPHNQDDCKYIIKLWDVSSLSTLSTGKELFTLSGHKDSVISLRFSSNCSRLVSASDDRNLKMWDPVNGTLLYTLGEGLGHSAGVLDVDWSPNQTLLVSGSRDFKVRLWNASTGLPLGKPWKDHNCVRSTQWHYNGKYILTAGVDQTIKIRNATTGKEMAIFSEAEETNSEVMSARWSPDGQTIASCSTRDATVRLYGIGGRLGETDDATDNWQIGLAIFFIVAVIGIILIFMPLRKEFREHRK